MHLNLIRTTRALLRSTALAVGLFAINPVGAVTEVAGVKFADAIHLGTDKLLLNGAGVRWRVVFKVYAAALYLSSKAETLDEVLAAPGAKRIRIVMLREIEADQISQLFLRGISLNLRQSEAGRLTQPLLKLLEAVAEFKIFRTGDVLTIDFDPSVGTVFQARGQAIGSALPGAAVFNAALHIWLGAKPADGLLKEALLGKVAPLPTASPGAN